MARTIFILIALVALVLAVRGLRERRRAYLQAATALLALLAIALTAVLSVGLRQPAEAPRRLNSPVAIDAARTLKTVRTSAFDSVTDCLTQLDHLREFYARYPDRFAGDLRDQDAMRAALGELPANDPRHCSELPALRARMDADRARLGEIVREGSAP